GAYAQGQTLFINEILVGNASTTFDTDYSNYSSWIEIYNGGNSSIDLKNYSLAYWDDGAPDPIAWKVPVSVSIPAKGYVIFWADEKNKNRHAKFGMDMRGDKLQLLAPGGAVLDEVTYDMRDSAKTLLPDISYGRQADGGAVWAWFDAPTPAASNNAAISYTTPNLAKGPTFSPPGGFYTGGQSITLSTDEAGGQIRYTLDGSIPTPSSPLYTGPITVSQPTAVRARVYASGKMAGQTVTHTYLIGVSRNLPVVSIATAPANLFDSGIGIYARWQMRQWERPASMEMYEIDGTRVVAQDIGIEIHGSKSRERAQKSLEIKARRTYGAKDIPYAFFDDKPIKAYKRLVLRNSGNDSKVLFTDLIQHYIVKDMMDIDYQAGRPVIVLLNGQYWGIYNIREKADEVYPEQNYGLDKDTDYDFYTQKAPEAGSTAAWESLRSFVSGNDMSVPANYDYVKSQVDIEEFMNYFIVELYDANADWPYNNIRFWRAYDGGKWRWVLYDLDMALQPKDRDGTTFVDFLTSSSSKYVYQSMLLRRLMQNAEFRSDFAQRFASHINITFDPARVEGFIGLFQSRIAAEMPAHIARWGEPASMTAWNSVINNNIRYFYGGRQTPMRNQLNAQIGSPGMANLTVNIVGGGDVKAAGVVVPGSGYTGPYFKNTPMSLEAVPRAGWAFVRWQETNSTDPKITVTLSGPLTRTAVFEQVDLPDIVINEIHYNPSDAQGDDALYEFFELYNRGDKTVDLSDFAITAGVEFTFPSGVTIAPGEYMILAQTAATYAGQGYQVFQWSKGGLNNSGEAITLSDNHGNAITSVTYSDSSPWPTAPDGNGPSLSLLATTLDETLPENWAASRETGGTPGRENFPELPPAGSITVAKVVVGEGAPDVDFTFLPSWGDAFTLKGGGEKTFDALTPGVYSVSEGELPDGWSLQGATCVNQVTRAAESADPGDIPVGDGDHWLCTFTNLYTAPPVSWSLYLPAVLK
ncbi:MAG: CotH kinase family protein, partial [Anaerolineae bacterium]|nr:CotH kinase family protein [Anaerolineae bacterium]